jgi:hypothetical protein
MEPWALDIGGSTGIHTHTSSEHFKSPAPGRAAQLDPMKPNLKPPETKRLKLKCDKLLSTSAFKFKLRRYSRGTTTRRGTTRPHCRAACRSTSWAGAYTR